MSDESKDLLNVAQATIDTNVAKVVKDIAEADDYGKVKDLTNLFNLAQAKKNVVRVATYGELLDTIGAEMLERIAKYPEGFSNDELVKYLNAVSGVVEKANGQVLQLNEVPPIQLNQQNNTVNLNVGTDTLDRESRERILNAVKAFMNTVNTTNNSGEEGNE